MASIISCPSCSRRLSLKQEASALQMVKCPICETVFSPPATSEAVQANTSTGVTPSFADTNFAATPFLFSKPGRDAAEDDDARRRRSEKDDQAGDSDDWPDIRRPLKTKKRRAALLGGGLLALITVAVAAFIMYEKRNDPAILGSWKGTFHFGFADMEGVYRFRPDGIVIDEHVNPVTGMFERGTGRYRFSRGEVHIQWDGPGVQVERGTVRMIDADTMEYVIVAHTDRAQINGRATLKRGQRVR